MSAQAPSPPRRPAADLWSLIHTERAALADQLAGLTDQQWATQSLCDAYTVREVVAHLTAGASLNPARWLAGALRCRFDFDRMNACGWPSSSATPPPTRSPDSAA